MEEESSSPKKERKPRGNSKDPARLLNRNLFEVNQILKKYEEGFNYSSDNECFYGRSDGAQFILSSEFEFPVTGDVFIPSDKSLADLLKDNFGITVNKNIIYGSDTDNKLILQKSSIKLTEENYSLLKFINQIDNEEIKPDFELISNNSILYYEDSQIFNFSVNNILECVKNNNSETGHDFIFLDCPNQNTVRIHKNKSSLDPLLPFLIFRSKALSPIKLGKKDNSYFSITFLNEYKNCILRFGKDNLNFVVGYNGTFRYTEEQFNSIN